MLHNLQKHIASKGENSGLSKGTVESVSSFVNWETPYS